MPHAMDTKAELPASLDYTLVQGVTILVSECLCAMDSETKLLPSLDYSLVQRVTILVGECF